MRDLEVLRGFYFDFIPRLRATECGGFHAFLLKSSSLASQAQTPVKQATRNIQDLDAMEKQTSIIILRIRAGLF
jgi:hypothetical protein